MTYRWSEHPPEPLSLPGRITAIVPGLAIGIGLVGLWWGR